MRIGWKCIKQGIRNIKQCILAELKESAKRCFINCLQFQQNDDQKNVEPTCSGEVEKVRATYNNSTREQRVILFARVYEEVRKRNPDSRVSSIALFMTFVFNPRYSPTQVCDKYKELFGKNEEVKKVEIYNDKNTIVEYFEEDKSRFF